MKINNLIGKPVFGMYKDRATGKSTALAFKYISEAIANPNKRVMICDHHGTREADKRLARYIRHLVDVLELKAIDFPDDLSICFNLYSDSDEYIELNGRVYKKLGEFE